MLIVCPSCATAYDVELASLPPQGRQVRCMRCRTVWRAASPQAERLRAAARAIAPRSDDPADAVGPAAKAPGPPPVAAAAPATPAAGAWHDVLWNDADALANDAAASEGRSLVAPIAPDPPADAAAGDGERTDSTIDAPSLVPADSDAGGPLIEAAVELHATHDAERSEDIETLAARRHRRRAARAPARWPLSPPVTAITALLIVDALLVGWRSEVVRVLPQTASFYALFGLPVNLRGLLFEGVSTTAEQYEGVPILVVAGTIANDTRKIVDVPRLQFIVRNAAKQEIYSWSAVPARGALPPGEAAPFRSRLASPPPEARDVLVRFVTQGDLVARTR